MKDDRVDGLRIAVVGATGCVGAAVCAAAERAGHTVLGMARRPPARPIAGRFLPLDVATARPREIAAVLEAEGISVVINAAGGWGTTEEEMTSAHVRLVEGLIAGMAMLPERARLVQVGTIHEYGSVPEGVLIGESLVPSPVTAYARSKFEGSRAALEADRSGAVDTVVLRAVNVCGPRTSRASFLGALVVRMRAAAPGERLEVTVSDARRDYLDVRDLAAAVLRATESKAALGRAVNIGRGEAVAVRGLVAMLAEAAGFPRESVHELEAPVHSKGGDWTRADIRLARRVLDWEPEIGLERSLRDMWQDGL
ncbi:NAD(P)-dependent oxidoreductase [Streptomyces cyaneofuscatus]|uniref:NAD-dependent epimerase/dehydratase family protein n=1 Tax=Streptomyces cyaneofuscatus TaxID=66883 RepID=UPI0033BA88B8